MKKTELHVKVSETRYDAFGIPNRRTRMLNKLLERMGGINESVDPGDYIFTARLNWKLQIVTDLRKA